MPQSPNGSPTRNPSSVPLIGFRQPEEPEIPSPHGATIPSPASSPEEAGHAPGSADEWLDESGQDESGGTPSPGSIPASGKPKKVANPIVGEGLRDTCRNAVIIGSAQAHSFLAKSQGRIEAQLYLADAEDAANIGDPVARIVARREGLGEVDPDTADMLAALMGLAGYATKQIQKNAIAQKLDARYAGTDSVQVLPTEEELR